MYPHRGVPSQFRACVSDDGTRVVLANRHLNAVPGWVQNLKTVATLDLSHNELTDLPVWFWYLTNLTELDLSHNQLTVAPIYLGNLAGMTVLRLDGNRLTGLPDSIGNLTALTVLSLNDNQLTTLPRSIGNLTSLTTLSINANKLRALPESICYLSGLTVLRLDGNRLTGLPDSIADLTALTVLGVNDNRLRTLPGSIGNLTALTSLGLSQNQLTDLPNSIGNLTALTVLSLNDNQLTRLPGSIGNLTALTSLGLDQNQLTDLPHSIGNLTALTVLGLNDNQLTTLPGSIGNLTALTSLGLDQNQLTDLPHSIGNLTGLTILGLNSNKLTALPRSVGNFIELSVLGVGGNRLADIPDSIGNLSALMTLGLDGNDLTTLPDSIVNLYNLSTLSARSNRLTELPNWIGNLAALTILSLDGNGLIALPTSIGNLTNLTVLGLSHNELTSLPESIGNLTALNTLGLSHNRLTWLPDLVGNLIDMANLSLDHNQLADLPISIWTFRSLSRVDLSYNQFTHLPRELAHSLANGLLLAINNNPLDDPLSEIIAHGTDSLTTYLRSLKDAAPQYETKLLLVGEGNVGKTSLIAALVGAPFVDGRPTTHGIEITQLTFRHPSLDVEIIVRAWDFGGQEVYRVTHQFFFSRRALYLMVWNARQGQEQDEVESWLRRIRLRVGHEARILIVATHCAERFPELDYPHLEQTFSGLLRGSYEVDNETQSGISELAKEIARQAAALPQMGQLISPRWVDARDEILERALTEPQIPYGGFVDACETHGVTGPEVLTLARLMHDLGHIIYYGADEGLKDIVVLNPEWLTKAISYVLEDKPTRETGGVLDHARLKDIWLSRDGGREYPLRYHPYFLRLMEKFDISYRLEGDELHSLVAQLVSHERPELPWESTTQPRATIRRLAMLCRFSEPAPGLIPWLTVRHHRASTGMHWRRGVFLRHPIAEYASEALLELRHSGELVLEVRAPSPDLYFNVLRDSIEDLITRRWPGLTYQLFIPCPGYISGSTCSGEFPLDTLLRMRERDRTFVTCYRCLEDYEISRLLTGFTMPTRLLDTELDEIHKHLTRIEHGVVRIENQAAEIAESVRRVLRVVGTEVADCPRLFTLVRYARSVSLGENHYVLTLWCEHPGYWHPWEAARYNLDVPKEWFVKIRPYAMLVFKTLKLVVPPAGALAEILLRRDQLGRAEGLMQLMSSLVADLPSELDQNLVETPLGETEGQLTVAEGQGLRAIRAILLEQDRVRAFGGLRRVQAPSAEFLWVCPEHYPEYDPGLPAVP
jgi:internalin A